VMLPVRLIRCMLSSMFTSRSSPRVLHSFPTRRSSDLFEALANDASVSVIPPTPLPIMFTFTSSVESFINESAIASKEPCTSDFRSEEHTSELQSRENLVCRLLLEKKNQE